MFSFGFNFFRFDLFADYGTFMRHNAEFTLCRLQPEVFSSGNDTGKRSNTSCLSIKLAGKSFSVLCGRKRKSNNYMLNNNFPNKPNKM